VTNTFAELEKYTEGYNIDVEINIVTDPGVDYLVHGSGLEILFDVSPSLQVKAWEMSGHDQSLF
jgi:hypothetical protein